MTKDEVLLLIYSKQKQIVRQAMKSCKTKDAETLSEICAEVMCEVGENCLIGKLHFTAEEKVLQYVLLAVQNAFRRQRDKNIFDYVDDLEAVADAQFVEADEIEIELIDKYVHANYSAREYLVFRTYMTKQKLTRSGKYKRISFRELAELAGEEVHLTVFRLIKRIQADLKQQFLKKD